MRRDFLPLAASSTHGIGNKQGGAPRVVLIDGSAGVGRATAAALAHRGWAVALIARGRPGLEGARRDIEAAGGRAVVLPADVADPEAVSRAAEQVVQPGAALTSV